MMLAAEMVVGFLRNPTAVADDPGYFKAIAKNHKRTGTKMG
jgi:hypothetical protein